LQCNIIVACSGPRWQLGFCFGAKHLNGCRMGTDIVENGRGRGAWSSEHGPLPHSGGAAMRCTKLDGENVQFPRQCQLFCGFENINCCMQNEINEINTGNKLAKLFINVKSLNNEWAYKRTEVQYFEKSFGAAGAPI